MAVTSSSALTAFGADRPALHLQPAASGYELSSRPPWTMDACNEPGPMTGVRRPRLQLAIEALEPMQHTAHAHDGVAPVARAAAVRRAAARLDFDPGEPLVSDRHLQIGRLGDDGAISRPVPDERVGADAGVFFVDDRGHDQPPSRQAAFRDHPRRVNHGGDAALHVLGSAAVEAGPIASRA